MKRFKAFSSVMLYSLLGIQLLVAQEKNKTVKETFKTDKEATITVNTSHTDVTFETWNQDKVEVEAVLEAEGLTKEELENYFKNWDFKAMGNSNAVEISTGNGSMMFFSGNTDFHFDIDIPEFSFNVDSLMSSITVPQPPPMVFPMVKNVDFDYQAYQKNPEKYMKEWQEEFKKNFESKAYEKEMEAWAKRVEKQQEAYVKRLEKQQEAAVKRQEAQLKRQEAALQRQEAIAKRQMEERQRQQTFQNTYFINTSTSGSGGTIIINKDGEEKTIKLKKKIHIKLPKDAKLKINVRHGEVKLADNITNIQATLSYAGLLAKTVSGDKTYITTSYAPVSVDEWNYGTLVANYSDNVHLGEVRYIDLSTTSSRVAIDRLIKKATINGRFSDLAIQSIAPEIYDLRLRFENTNAKLPMPNVYYIIEGNYRSSNIKYPKTWSINSSNGYLRGNNQGSQVNKKMILSSLFSDVDFTNK